MPLDFSDYGAVIAETEAAKARIIDRFNSEERAAQAVVYALKKHRAASERHGVDPIAAAMDAAAYLKEGWKFDVMLVVARKLDEPAWWPEVM